MADDLSISVIVPACRRVTELRRTLLALAGCDPAPAEVLVHVDGASPEVMAMIEQEFPQIRLLANDGELLGPGGARNRLIAAAQHEWVANFDDDSFPDRTDYFARVAELARRFPNAAMFSAAGQPSEWVNPQFQQMAVFSGCGCVFRKSWMALVPGFVPLPVAYGMEEVDVSLQLHARGGVLIHDPELRIRHEHPLEPCDDVSVSAQATANAALLPFLRYPWSLWPIGLLQVLNALRWQVLHGSVRAAWKALIMIPGRCWHYRSFRRSVPVRAVLSWLRLRRCPKPVGLARLHSHSASS